MLGMHPWLALIPDQRLGVYLWLGKRPWLGIWLSVYLWLDLLSCTSPLKIAFALRQNVHRLVGASRQPPERRFKAFLAPGPKPLPERLIFIAREPFFGLDRISGFWSLQKAVLPHFWFLAQNHCQNGLFSLRARHFSVWTEYLIFEASRKPF